MRSLATEPGEESPPLWRRRTASVEPLPHPLTLRYAQPLEGDVQAELTRRAVGRARLTVLLLAVAILAPALVEVVGQPARVEERLTSFLMALVVLALLIPLSSRHGERWLRPTVAALILAIGFGRVAVMLRDQGTAEAEAIGAVSIVFVLGIAFTVVRLRFTDAAPLTLAITLAWVGATLVTGLVGNPQLYFFVGLAYLFSALAGYSIERYARQEIVARRLLDAERQVSQRLLLNVLPASVAQRLADGSPSVADSHPDVTVLFADIVGFTAFAARVAPSELVETLNAAFTALDGLTTRHRLTKIKTIGDAYLLVGGLPEARPDHAEAVAAWALDLPAVLAAIPTPTGQRLQARVGIHIGPVVAGVIGSAVLAYDVWGDTVNVAARMEAQGVPGAIQVSAATADRLRGQFLLSERGTVEIRGKGLMRTYLLVGHAGEDWPTPGA